MCHRSFWAMAPKFSLFTKGSKLPLNQGSQNRFLVTTVSRQALDIQIYTRRRLKTLLQKEKLPMMHNFPLCHNVFIPIEHYSFIYSDFPIFLSLCFRLLYVGKGLTIFAFVHVFFPVLFFDYVIFMFSCDVLYSFYWRVQHILSHITVPSLPTHVFPWYISPVLHTTVVWSNWLLLHIHC